jgi:hypothetical protein
VTKYGEPETARQDTGRKGYREPHEPRDERPLLSCQPFWESAEEQDAYELAVRQNPRGKTPPGEYIRRIAQIVEERVLAKWPGVGTMPHAPGRKATERRIAFLEEQREPGEDG